MLKIENLSVEFYLKKNLFGRRNFKEHVVYAVDDVSFQIRPKEIFSLIGESGSGKSTLARAILQLIPIKKGKILFRNQNILQMDKQGIKHFRRQAQMIFQDPYQSLNPKMQIFDIVSEALLLSEQDLFYEEIENKVLRALHFSGLRPAKHFLHQYPYELSGGQRQRVSIAACLVMNPSLIIADEPVSMLDASIRSDILRLFVEMKQQNDLSLLFITHDLSLAWLISDYVAVMYLGKIMEAGPVDILEGKAAHPYTKALLSVVPPSTRPIFLSGEIPTAFKHTEACRFYNRCPYAAQLCRTMEPKKLKLADEHIMFCHFRNFDHKEIL